MARLLRVLLLQAVAIVLVMRTVLDLSVFGDGAVASTAPFWSPESQTTTSRPHYDRAVVVLIDALRADMLLERPEMRYTRALLRRSDPAVAAAYVTTAQTPTVTMPRIKAIVTGGIPSFADILHNFDSAALREDNLVRRLHAAGQRLVLLGDDTWLKLFPAEFGRSDGKPPQKQHPSARARGAVLGALHSANPQMLCPALAEAQGRAPSRVREASRPSGRSVSAAWPRRDGAPPRHAADVTQARAASSRRTSSRWTRT